MPTAAGAFRALGSILISPFGHSPPRREFAGRTGSPTGRSNRAPDASRPVGRGKAARPIRGLPKPSRGRRRDRLCHVPNSLVHLGQLWFCRPDSTESKRRTQPVGICKANGLSGPRRFAPGQTDCRRVNTQRRALFGRYSHRRTAVLRQRRYGGRNFAFHGFLRAGRPCASPRGGFSFQRPAAGLSGDRRGGAAKRVFGSSPQDGGDAFASYSAVYIRVFRKESGTQCRAAQSRAAH